MRRTSIAFLVSIVSAFVAPATLLADNPTNGTILVLGDHVLPGQPFSVTGYDIDPGIDLELAITNGTRTASLGHAVVSGDGTLNATVDLASDFPVGYANLTATSPADGQWTTAVLVGERAEGPQPVGDQNGADVGAIGLLMFAVGLVVFALAGWRYLRGQRAASL